MARPKKSSANEPKPDDAASSESAHESAENEGMAHVRADELAGSPDIFARKADGPAACAETGSASAGQSETMAEPKPEPVAEPEPERVTEPAAAPVDAQATTDSAGVARMPPPPITPPPATYIPPPSAPRSRAGSGVAIGIVLVVVGIFFFVVQLAGVVMGSYVWPLFIIIPGLTLLIVGFVGLVTGAAIPGGILTMVVLVLAYQNSSGNWASWVYVWPLVAPGGVGVGLFLQGMRDRNVGLIKQGRSLIVIAFLIFMIGFVFFESILHLTGTDYGLFGKVALPGLLVVIGVALLVRALQRSRSA